MLTLTPPKDHNGAVVTRYRGKPAFTRAAQSMRCCLTLHCLVEWSTRSDFQGAQCLVIPAVTEEYLIEGLQSGVPCYVRVASCNLKGTGPFASSSPESSVPSTWREFNPIDSVATTSQKLSTLETDMVSCTRHCDALTCSDIDEKP